MGIIQIKRIYDKPENSDGLRVLVDRLWPRGVKKEYAHVDVWMKEVTPSPALRIWFNHEPEKWAEFSAKYTFELTHEPEAVNELLQYASKHKIITLLYAAKDKQHTHALVLQAYLQSLIQNHAK